MTVIYLLNYNLKWYESWMWVISYENDQWQPVEQINSNVRAFHFQQSNQMIEYWLGFGEGLPWRWWKTEV